MCALRHLSLLNVFSVSECVCYSLFVCVLCAFVCVHLFVCLHGFVLRQVCPGTVVSVIGSVNSQFRVNFSVNNQYLQTEQGGAP